MRVKVSVENIKGQALDWAVAYCRGLVTGDESQGLPGQDYSYKPSSNWAQGGEILENLKGFEFKQWMQSAPESCCEAHIHDYDGNSIQFGPTPLIAAMRCYVDHSMVGDFIEIPQFLVNQ